MACWRGNHFLLWQYYDLFKTEDLPSMEGSQFSPIVSFTSHCTKYQGPCVLSGSPMSVCWQLCRHLPYVTLCYVVRFVETTLGIPVSCCYVTLSSATLNMDSPNRSSRTLPKTCCLSWRPTVHRKGTPTGFLKVRINTINNESCVSIVRPRLRIVPSY